jgi:hypothetical protein
MTQALVLLSVPQPGVYRVAVSYSPYWSTSVGCLGPERDGMTTLTVPRPAVVAMRFVLTTQRALEAVAGEKPVSCG